MHRKEFLKQNVALIKSYHPELEALVSGPLWGEVARSVLSIGSTELNRPTPATLKTTIRSDIEHVFSNVLSEKERIRLAGEIFAVMRALANLSNRVLLERAEVGEISLSELLRVRYQNGRQHRELLTLYAEWIAFILSGSASSDIISRSENIFLHLISASSADVIGSKSTCSKTFH